MSKAAEFLADYGSYHRDVRNELTHVVGIPAILLSALMATANVPLFAIGGVYVDLGWVVVAALTAFYVSLNVTLGVAMGVVLVALQVLGVVAFGRSLWVALGLFVGGWALQFVGHIWEGKRPAFTKNAIHLLIGPAWIVEKCLERLGVTVVRADG